ncbi:c-type cytochrome [Diaphorobacter sp.]|uniref:c-type cytochrome n=1 Tax=Diaphorobacter sp. TaxID=1934310 RepID=UPI0028A959D6|nr:c-type cytochrome [Diaphorobacter sp.]
MKPLRQIGSLVLLGWALGSVAPALAQSAQDNARALPVRQLAANCAACHGTDGRAVTGSPVAALAGMPAGKTMEALQDYKAGKREPTVMHQIAKGLTDAQMKTLADYFAAQKP